MSGEWTCSCPIGECKSVGSQGCYFGTTPEPSETTDPTAGERAHHPDCPARYFADHPERCRCVFMAMLDRPATPDAGDASEGLSEAESFRALGATIHRFRCTNPECRHYEDEGYFTPRDNDAASAVWRSDWLAARESAAETKARAEALREAADEVQAVFDMQCPPRSSHFANDGFGRGALCAHQWWNTVLGGQLRRLRDRAASIARGDAR